MCCVYCGCLEIESIFPVWVAVAYGKPKPDYLALVSLFSRSHSFQQSVFIGFSVNNLSVAAVVHAIGESLSH